VTLYLELVPSCVFVFDFVVALEFLLGRRNLTGKDLVVHDRTLDSRLGVF